MSRMRQRTSARSSSQSASSSRGRGWYINDSRKPESGVDRSSESRQSRLSSESARSATPLLTCSLGIDTSTGTCQGCCRLRHHMNTWSTVHNQRRSRASGFDVARECSVVPCSCSWRAGMSLPSLATAVPEVPALIRLADYRQAQIGSRRCCRPPVQSGRRRISEPHQV